MFKQFIVLDGQTFWAYNTLSEALESSAQNPKTSRIYQLAPPNPNSIPPSLAKKDEPDQHILKLDLEVRNLKQDGEEWRRLHDEQKTKHEELTVRVETIENCFRVLVKFGLDATGKKWQEEKKDE